MASVGKASEVAQERPVEEKKTEFAPLQAQKVAEKATASLHSTDRKATATERAAAQATLEAEAPAVLRAPILERAGVQVSSGDNLMTITISTAGVNRVMDHFFHLSEQLIDKLPGVAERLVPSAQKMVPTIAAALPPLAEKLAPTIKDVAPVVIDAVGDQVVKVAASSSAVAGTLAQGLAKSTVNAALHPFSTARKGAAFLGLLSKTPAAAD